MPRLVHAALVLLLAAVVPTVAIAEACGGMAMPCCTAKPGTATLGRPGCCSVPCFEASQGRHAPASETRQVRLDLPQVHATTLAEDAPAATPLAGAASRPAVSPPLSRRLASLSILLI